MKQIRIILVLTVVSLFSAGILSLADRLTKDKIEENQRKAINEAIISIEPETRKIEKKDDFYEIFDKNKKLLGFVFLAEGQGYQGTIKIICGLSSSLDRLLGIEIIDSRETPGLGARINDSTFKGQFSKLKVSPPIEYTKTETKQDNQIQAITGATVSSRSVVNILNSKIEQIRDLLNKR